MSKIYTIIKDIIKDTGYQRAEAYETAAVTKRAVELVLTTRLYASLLGRLLGSRSLSSTYLAHREYRLCIISMEGEEFLTINPDTLSDRGQWRYRDLQLLCMRLSLGGR